MTRLRHREWFDSDDPVMAALYLERYLNYGLTRDELTGDRPIIGIAQTGSDLSPCNRHHLVLAQRVREGIRDAGGVPIEFPVHPIQEGGRRPTAALDRNLAYLGLVEVLHGYPLDGVVLLTGCDKTTPACLMAAATADLPAIVLSVGPMLDGWFKGQLAGSGSVIWQAREELAAGRMNRDEVIELAAASAPSAGHCNTMGTASTMNALAEALGMSLAGCAAIPAPYRERGQMAYATGRRAVDLVREDVRPSAVMTRQAFENAIVACSAIGGSTNAPIHLNAIARCLGVELTNADWERVGHAIPLLVNMQPAGAFLGETYFHAGGLPAVLGELVRAGLLPHPDAMTVSGQTVRERCRRIGPARRDPIGRRSARERGRIPRPLREPVRQRPDEDQRDLRRVPRALPVEPGRPGRVRGPRGRLRRARGLPRPHRGSRARHRWRHRARDARRRCDRLPRIGRGRQHDRAAHLVERGIGALPCIGDGRQSGTSGSPSILNASPEAAVGGGLALLATGDRVRIDLGRRRVDALVPASEWERRRVALDAAGGYPIPPSQTPWQALHRREATQLADGMTLRIADGFHDVARQVPRHNH